MATVHLPPRRAPRHHEAGPRRHLRVARTAWATFRRGALAAPLWALALGFSQPALAQSFVCPDDDGIPGLQIARPGTAAYVLYESGRLTVARTDGDAGVVRLAAGGPRMVRVDRIRAGDDAPVVIACGEVEANATFSLPQQWGGQPLRARDRLRVRIYGPSAATGWPRSVRTYRRELDRRAHALDERLDVWVRVVATGAGDPIPTAPVLQADSSLHAGAGSIEQSCEVRAGWQRVADCPAGPATVLTASLRGIDDDDDARRAGAHAAVIEQASCGQHVARSQVRCSEAQRLRRLLENDPSRTGRDALRARGRRLERDLRSALGAWQYAGRPVEQTDQGPRALYPLAAFELPSRHAARRLDLAFDAGEYERDRHAPGARATVVVSAVPTGLALAFGDRAEAADDRAASAIVAFARFTLAAVSSASGGSLAEGGSDGSLAEGGGDPPRYEVTRIETRDDRAPTVAALTSRTHFLPERDADVRRIYVCEGARCIREGDDANVRTSVVLRERRDWGVALLVDASANLGSAAAYGTPTWELSLRNAADGTSDCDAGTAGSRPCYRLSAGTAGFVTGAALVGFWARAGDTRLLAALGATFTPDVDAGMLFQGDIRLGVELVSSLFLTVGLGLRVVSQPENRAVGDVAAGRVDGDMLPLAPGLSTTEGLEPLLTVGLAFDLITLGDAAAKLVAAL